MADITLSWAGLTWPACAARQAAPYRLSSAPSWCTSPVLEAAKKQKRHAGLLRTRVREKMLAW
jgi:hypothetical protein